jgi:hypothetical protein
LLEDIGLAPHASFKAEEIVGYSSSFLLRMKELWRACGDAYVVELKKIITDKNSQCFDAEITTPLDHYGLIGFKIFNEMRPSLYIGALLDTAAYHVEYSNQQKGPDCSIILTFDEPFHCRYSDSAFMELKETIRTAFIDKPNGWSFFSHIDSPDSETKNHWHSLYIRKPLIEVLSFGLADSSLQEQAQRLKKALDIPINILFNRTSLLAYRESKYALESINLSSELLYRRIAAVLQESKLDAFVWSNRSQMYLCIKFTQNTNLAAGFKLQVTDDAVKFWLFFDPHADPLLIEELINKTAPDTPLFKEQNQMVAVYETLNTRSIEEIYQHCESTIRALGFTEDLPQFPEMARLSNTSKK